MKKRETKKIIASKPNNENRIQGFHSGEAQIIAAKDDKSLPKISMSAYTGGVMGQPWGDVIIDLDGVQFAKTVALLWHHDTGTPVGHSVQAKVADGEIKIEGVMSGDPDNEKVKMIRTMAKNGFPWQVSIGADILKSEYIESGDSDTVNGIEVKGPLTIARRSMVVESSFLPLGADSNTVATVAAKKSSSIQTHITGELDMEFKKWLKANGFGDAKNLDETVIASLQVLFDAEQKTIKATKSQEKTSADEKKTSEGEIKALKTEVAEIKRVSEIKAETADYTDLQKTAIEGKWSTDQVKAQIVELKKVQADRSSPVSNINVGATQKGAIAASLDLRMGVKAESLKGDFSDDAIDQAMGMECESFSQLSAQLLSEKGSFNVMAGKEETIRAAFGTTDLPNILSNTANKILLDEKQAQAGTWDLVSAANVTSDFKQISLNDLTMDLTLLPIGANGEPKHGTVGDSVQTARIGSFARSFQIGRQTLINDDLDAFRRVFVGFGKGAFVAEERAGWTTFAGATFGTSLSGPGSALGIDGLTDAVEALDSQVDENGDPIFVDAMLLVVPPAQKTVAFQLMNTTIVTNGTTSAQPNSNPHAGIADVIVAPYLNNANVPGASPDRWYLMAAPTSVQALLKLNLSSAPNPVTRRGDVAIGDGFGINTDTVYDFGSVAVTAKNFGVVENAGT